MSPIYVEALALALAQLTPATPPAATDFGRDLVCIDDIDEQGSETDDPQTILLQDLYHRFTTMRGLVKDAPDDGLDLIGMLHKGLSRVTLLRIEAAIVGEAHKDERVATCDATAATARGGEELRIKIVVTPKDPTLETLNFVLVVTNGGVLLEILG